MPIKWNRKPKERKLSVRVGDAVRIHRTDLSSLGMPQHKVAGGEGVLASISEDRHGTVYTVRLNRNGKMRSVRQQHLTVHYKKNRSRDDGKDNRGGVQDGGRGAHKGRKARAQRHVR